MPDRENPRTGGTDAGAVSIPADGSNNTSSIRKAQPTEAAYAAYKHAEAEFDLAWWSPENCGSDLPDDQSKPLRDKIIAARRAFFATPAEDLGAVLSKLHAYQCEEMYDGGDDEGEFTGHIAEDVRRLYNREADRG